MMWKPDYDDCVWHHKAEVSHGVIISWVWLQYQHMSEDILYSTDQTYNLLYRQSSVGSVVQITIKITPQLANVKAKVYQFSSEQSIDFYRHCSYQRL